MENVNNNRELLNKAHLQRLLNKYNKLKARRVMLDSIFDGLANFLESAREIGSSNVSALVRPEEATRNILKALTED